MNTTEQVDELERRGMAFALGAVLTSYPDPAFRARLRDLEAAAEAGFDLVWSDEDVVDELRSEYIELFDKKDGHIPLYETEYGAGRSLAKGHELADLAGFYRAFGLDLGGIDSTDGLTELPDHIAVELEFCGYLLLKEAHLTRSGDGEGVEIVRDARRKFLVDHLGRFVPTIVEQVGKSRSGTYQRIFGWCQELVGAECARLGADPGAPRARPADVEEDHMECGALPILR